MFDLTIGETKKFEQLPEDKWVLGRLTKREVKRWSETDTKYVTSADEVIKKLILKSKSVETQEEALAVKNELKGYQFEFTFKILEDKKYSGYVIKGLTGIWLSINNQYGEYDPNKLGRWFLGMGGKEGKKGEVINIDSVIGNYVAIKVESKKDQRTKKVYQKVAEVRELTDDELITAKENEVIIDKVAKAMKDAEDRSIDSRTETKNLTQVPVLDIEKKTKDVPF